ncbi:calcium load-activated calcium channel isoform X2 [Balaenoptera ricei]|uniref:calcium load-activated calcium channel isoform X2 n=1 Tax=Balaenoptera ricei TaxID=2746895 RepID=UPI0028BF0A25|nr:calcium load-activated calcium channel isoform X2 [Balaenoptera ricei]
MSTMFADTLLIVFISVCTALLAEGITWVLVYRTDKYKRLKAEVEKQSKKLEKKKETITESAGRQQKKKIDLMVEWWQSSLSPPFPTSKDCLIEICWGMIPQTVPSSSCIFSVPCQFDRTSRRSLALPLHEPPPSRQVDFLALHLLLGSSLEFKKNPVIPVILFRHSNQTGNYFVARAIGSLSTWATF